MKKTYESIIKDLKAEIKKQKALMAKYNKEMTEAKAKSAGVVAFSEIYDKYRKAKQQVAFKTRALQEKERGLAKRREGERKKKEYAAKHKK